jgi:thiamine biosynthesis protein ThiI
MAESKHTVNDFGHVVIHYGEIGLKAGNRRHFERILIRNIQCKLGDAFGECRRETGQLSLTLAPDADLEAVRVALSRIPGIVYFSPATLVPTDPIAFAEHGIALLGTQEFETFRIATHRHNKSIKLRSMEVNRELGAAVLEAFPDKRVKLNHPDATLKVEITGEMSYLSIERIQGVGGLPTDPRQKVVAMLSGGLDSPVAAYLMMKRGCEVILTHFQNLNEMTTSVEDKIQQLAAQLSHFQVKTTLHIVPFGELQREIIKHVKASQRMLAYRRIMMQMSTKIAWKSKARMIVMGDSLSQVASQTYDNLAATYAGSEMPILSPLIGLDKQEITDLSRRIGTYEISSLPYEDCCTFFVPRHPELRGTVEMLRDNEEGMDLEPLMKEALKDVSTYKW